MKPQELQKIEAYLRKTFQAPAISVRARPRKDDSAEVFIGEEFLGILFKDEDEGELSYNFSMAILEMDLDD